jgi:hypothetical protein
MLAGVLVLLVFERVAVVLVLMLACKASRAPHCSIYTGFQLLDVLTAHKLCMRE